MIRIMLVIAACAGLVSIGIAIWFAGERNRHGEQAEQFFDAPRQFDTTGGQEMQPRWGNGEGQGDGTIGN